MSGPGGERWERSAREVLAWIEARDWKGHDPFDLLASPFAAPVRPFRWPSVAWVQLGKRLPWDPRSVLRVPATENPKALALGGSAEPWRSAARARRSTSPASRGWRRLLDRQDATGGWGYAFPWANRSFRAPAGTPSSVVTAFAGHALLDVAPLLPDPDAARAAVLRGCAFVVRDLGRIPAPGGGFLFSYTPLDRRSVHNASVLAASLLARAADLPGAGAGWAEDARRAARTTLDAQRPDGSWPYGLTRRDAFVDAFHTAYVLEALRGVARDAGLPGTDDALRTGLAYWRETFLTGPAVGDRPGRNVPVDLHAVASGILTCLAFRDLWPQGTAHAERLGEWALAHARRPDGAFIHLWRPQGTHDVPYLRWVQAWMYLALAELAAWRHSPSGLA